MSELTLIVDGTPRVFDGTRAVTLGRDPSSDVVFTAQGISRQHARLEPTPDGWLLIDLGSTQGTWHEGSRVVTLPVTASTLITLGSGATAVRIEVVPGQVHRPGGALRANIADATEVGEDEIAVECSGRSYRATSHRALTIGRGDDNDVVSANPTVSRHHARIDHDGTSWRITDVGSARGMHVNGKQVTQEALLGTTVVLLGDPDAGERLVIAAPGVRPVSAPERVVREVRRNRPLLAVAAAALALAVGLAGWGVWSLLSPKTLDRDALARGTVRITASDWSGSGTIIDKKRGLVLTNAHVAAPLAPGQGVRGMEFLADMGEDAKDLTVETAKGLDKNATPTFRAKVLAADGYLDLAVLKLTGTVNGEDLEESLAQLVEIPIASSKDVASGDPVTVVGFPGVANSRAATFTSGVISGRRMSPRIEGQPWEFNSDVNVSPGNSGGLAADSRGRLIAVPTVLHLDVNAQINGLVPSDLAAPLIAKALAGEEYVSPYTTDPGSVTSTAQVLSGGASSSFGTECVGESSVVGASEVTYGMSYAGLTTSEHTDVLAEVYVERGGKLVLIGRQDSAENWPLKLASSGCLSVGIALDEPIAVGVYEFWVGIGPNHEKLNKYTLTVQ